MKSLKIYILLLSSFFICFISCTSVPSGYEKTVVDNIYERYDDFKDVYFYKHSEFFDYEEPFEVYIVKESERKYIRAVFTYTGDDWIFFDNAIIMNENNDRQRFSFDILDKNNETYKDDDEIKVCEKIDIVLSNEQIELLYNLCKKQNAKMQLNGKKSKNYRNIDDEAAVEVIDFYNSL